MIIIIETKDRAQKYKLSAAPPVPPNKSEAM